MFTYNRYYYVPTRNDIEIDLRVDVFNRQIRMYRNEKYYKCIMAKYRGPRKKSLMDNQKNLEHYLEQKQTKQEFKLRVSVSSSVDDKNASVQYTKTILFIDFIFAFQTPYLSLVTSLVHIYPTMGTVKMSVLF